MKPQSIDRNVSHGLVREKLESIPPRQHKEFIKAQALAFSERYRSVMAGFEKIFEIVGYEDYADHAHGVRKTNKINLGRRQTELGEGMLVAALRARGIDEKSVPYSDVTTSVDLESRDGVFPVDDEWFHGTGIMGSVFISHVPEILYDTTGEWPFEVDNRFGQDSPQKPQHRLAKVWDEIGPVIEKAEETQAMLWEAITNPELNPGLAERAAALQQS